MPSSSISGRNWVVTGAGTGATSATLGQWIQSHGESCRVAVADPENSAYFPGWTLDLPDYGTGMPSRIEGIGRPRVEPGFRPDLVDLVVPVPDAASVAAARHVREVTGLPVGASSGTALWAALELVDRMRARGENGQRRLADSAGRFVGSQASAAEGAGELGLGLTIGQRTQASLTRSVWLGFGQNSSSSRRHN
ncbi:pyridoxal-phosphate dependent enzyme [Streptosporangium amethystogenes subsp. fukuiense]|uniref:pyridoxal-phosphate dependent enzyme n=1 Tax=Streptosporangium amethystogenes TaxID=2002 RepID=UPI003620CE18